MENADQTSESLERVGYPHDAFFKDVFSDPEIAAAFLQSHLPPTIVAKIDWPSLVLVPSSFVKSTLQQLHSDLIFSVKIGDRQSLLYLIFEHQSSVDLLMPLRLLGYVTELLTKHAETDGLPLPPVLPFVLSQGPQRWQVSTAFEDCFDLPEEIAPLLLPYLPKFHHALLDLTQFDWAKEKDPRIQIVLELMKSVQGADLIRFFAWLATTPATQLPKSLLGKVLLYALHCDRDLDVKRIYTTLSTNPELQETTMSVAEKLIAEGRQEGRQEGLQKGRQEGVWIGKIQALEEFLDLEITSKENLSQQSLDELMGRHKTLHQAYEIKFKRK